MTPNFRKFSQRKPVFWSYFYRKVAKFGKILIIIFRLNFSCSHPMPPLFFFLFALTECPWVRKSQPYTYIHFILKCRPPLPPTPPPWTHTLSFVELQKLAHQEGYVNRNSNILDVSWDLINISLTAKTGNLWIVIRFWSEPGIWKKAQTYNVYTLVCN